MAEIDVLSRKIDDLKDWQTLAWRRIADPEVTTFERREIRNHLKESDEELRRCLGMMSDRFRFNPRPQKDVGNSLANIKFKLLG
jgi:hypothetical protein